MSGAQGRGSRGQTFLPTPALLPGLKLPGLIFPAK